MSEEVITIESDDEGDPLPGASSYSSTMAAAAPLAASTSTLHFQPQQSHSAYANYARPGQHGMMTTRGAYGYPLTTRGRGRGSRSRGRGARSLIPKRPGPMPPFAVFSQENRSKLQDENPEMCFADIGRTLGEMWHNLTEEQKEGYRRRAKVVETQKLKRWEAETAPLRKQLAAQEAAMIRQRQQQLAAAATMASATVSNPPLKRRRTNGFTIFSAEMRRQLSGQYPAEQLAEAVAQAWRDAAADTKNIYETRANKLNIIEERRFNAAQAARQQEFIRQRAVASSAQGSSASASFRISNVHSVNAGSQPAASNKLKLPSGISISRVDTDGSMLEEQPRLRNLPASTQFSVGGSLGRRGQPGRPPLLMRGGIARGASAAAAASWGNTRPFAGQKRPLLSNQQQMMAAAQALAKRQRLQGAPHGGGADTLKLGLPVSPADLGSGTERMCRLCGEAYPKVSPVYTLHDKPQILSKIVRTLGISIDVERDSREGYPNLICRKCCHTLSTFSAFKKVVEDGMGHLKAIIGKKSSSGNATEAPEAVSPPRMAASDTPWIISEDDHVGEDDEPVVMEDKIQPGEKAKNKKKEEEESMSNDADESESKECEDPPIPAPIIDEGKIDSDDAHGNEDHQENSKSPSAAAEEALEASDSGAQEPLEQSQATSETFDPLNFVQVSSVQTLDSLDPDSILEEEDDESEDVNEVDLPNGEDNGVSGAENLEYDANSSETPENFDSDSQTQSSVVKEYDEDESTQDDENLMEYEDQSKELQQDIDAEAEFDSEKEQGETEADEGGGDANVEKELEWEDVADEPLEGNGYNEVDEAAENGGEKNQESNVPQPAATNIDTDDAKPEQP